VAQRVAPQSRIADFTQPVALMLPGVAHHIPGTGQARSIVRRLVAALAPGSLLTINHSTSAVHGAAMEEAVAYWNRAGTPSMTLRTPADRRLLRRAGPAASGGGVVLPLACGVPESRVWPDLLLYCRRSWSCASSTCSWSGCSAGWCY